MQEKLVHIIEGAPWFCTSTVHKRQEVASLPSLLRIYAGHTKKKGAINRALAVLHYKFIN